MQYRKRSFYEKYVKRVLDVVFALIVLIFFWWLYLLIAIVVRVKMGSPVIFIQVRPGMINKVSGEEQLFNLYKFRSMSNKVDENGELLSDEERLSGFGRFLRRTSMDELPEIFNIISGKMSFVGPRPQLVRDMVFMTKEQRSRHSVLPGLTGLAQVNGRNAISWEKKIEWDTEYIKEISFFTDLRIVIRTGADMFKSLLGIGNPQETEVTDDYGVYLLKKGFISENEFKEKILIANNILNEYSKDRNRIKNIG